MKISIINDVTVEPIIIDEIRTHINYLGDNIDELNSLIRMAKSARIMIENSKQIALGEKNITIQIEKEYDVDEKNAFEIPIAPINSILSVYAENTQGVLAKLILNTGYYVRGIFRKEIYIPETWSTVTVGQSYSTIGWQINADVGYTRNNIPSIYKDAILELVAKWYNNKGNYVPELTKDVMLMLESTGDAI